MVPSPSTRMRLEILPRIHSHVRCKDYLWGLSSINLGKPIVSLIPCLVSADEVHSSAISYENNGVICWKGEPVTSIADTTVRRAPHHAIDTGD